MVSEVLLHLAMILVTSFFHLFSYLVAFVADPPMSACPACVEAFLRTVAEDEEEDEFVSILHGSCPLPRWCAVSGCRRI